MGLCFITSMLNRGQQCRIQPDQSCQAACINFVGFSRTFVNEVNLAGIRNNYPMSDICQQ